MDLEGLGTGGTGGKGKRSGHHQFRKHRNILSYLVRLHSLAALCVKVSNRTLL
jgi:hypothetical protein